MATVIVAKARKMLGIRCKIGNAGIDDATCTLGQTGKAGTMALWPSFEDKPQPLFDQVTEFAATQGRLRIGSAVKVVWNFDSDLHGRTSELLSIHPYLWTLGRDFAFHQSLEGVHAPPGRGER